MEAKAMRRSLTTLATMMGASERPALAAFDDSAFQQGAGQAGGDLLSAIAAIVAALALGGLAWIAYASFKAFADGSLSAADMTALLLRASALLIIIGVFIR